VDPRHPHGPEVARDAIGLAMVEGGPEPRAAVHRAGQWAVRRRLARSRAASTSKSTSRA
jgi:hypothetical protein